MFTISVAPMFKRPARKCLRMIGRARELMQPQPAASTTLEPVTDLKLTPFLCNVCGSVNILPQARLTREDGHCSTCQCYGRLRSMMYAVTTQFSPPQPILAWMAPRKDIRGLGCSDWGYTGLLGEKFDYVNTFYDHEPQLDLCNVDWSRWAPASFDFISCTDVLEHIEPPVQRVFDNMHKLLKPGGVAILTVPTTLDPTNREHFPALKEWKIEERAGQRVLVNRRSDGVVERFDDLCWHGGEGMTLEFRVFSRQGLLDGVEQAGLRIARILDQSVPGFAIPLGTNNFVLVAEKPVTSEVAAVAPEGPSIRVPIMYDDVVRRVATPHRYQAIETMLSANDERYAELLRDLSRYTDRLFRIAVKCPEDPCEPYFEDAIYFSHLDAVALYLLTAHYKPRHIIEIGSGSSTKYMRLAVKDWSLPTKIASIDPHPRAEIDAICDEVVRKNVLDVSPSFFQSLGENDFLFVDGSHLVFSGSDLPYIFFEILPVLAPGVIVHFHDIFLPDDYPANPRWQELYWNEQFCLAAFLSHNRDYSVLLPNHYLGTLRPELIAENLDLSQAPSIDGVNFRSGASFWIRKH